MGSEYGWRVRMESNIRYKQRLISIVWMHHAGMGGIKLVGRGEGLKRVEKKGVNDYPRITLFKPSYKFTSSLL